MLKSHGMFTAFQIASPIACDAASVQIAHAGRNHHRRRKHSLHLSVRSTETAAVEVPGPFVSSSEHTHDILKRVNKSSRQELAACEANASMVDAEMRSLLLRIAAFHYLWCRFHAEADPTLCDINALISKVVVMTHVLAGGNSQHVLQTIE